MYYPESCFRVLNNGKWIPMAEHSKILAAERAAKEYKATHFDSFFMRESPEVKTPKLKDYSLDLYESGYIPGEYLVEGRLSSSDPTYEVYLPAYKSEELPEGCKLDGNYIKTTKCVELPLKITVNFYVLQGPCKYQFFTGLNQMYLNIQPPVKDFDPNITMFIENWRLKVRINSGQLLRFDRELVVGEAVIMMGHYYANKQ